MEYPIKEDRKSKGMTQSDLAKLIGVTRPAITQIENGAVSPSIQTLYKIWEVLGTKQKRRDDHIRFFVEQSKL